MINDFFFYAGPKSAGREKCGAADIVLRLVEELPHNQNFQLFMDNWFSTLSLLSQLKSMGILSIATFCANGLGGCPLMSKKDLKKSGCGSFNYRTDMKTGMHLLKWFDNKCVVVGSTFTGVECTETVERYDPSQKKKVKIDCPDMVLQYNKSMGGVDLVNMLIAVYRTRVITQKHWYLKLIFHCIDIAKVIAWLLYRGHCNQRSVQKKSVLIL